ncbi:MAG TPA: sigma-70 family RNA polymerase sigma factor [Capsulimonadaceae bacterium]|jgi:RNA polymerase sigma-B factor
MENNEAQNAPLEPASVARQDDENRTKRLLSRYAETKDPGARDHLVEQYRPLVEKLARRFTPTGIPLEDLVQEGYIGLLHAIDHFDVSKNVKFITYATHCVSGHLRHYLRDRGQIIKEPAWLQELSQRVRRATDALMQSLGRQPSTSEIAETVGLTEDVVRQVESTRQLFSVASLDESFDDGSRTLGDTDAVSSSGGGSSADQSASFELPIEEKVVLEAALTRLKELEQRVVYLFYYDDRSQTEIAKELGISNNYVSHILKNSARKLQQMYRSEAVREAALQYERQCVRSVASQNQRSTDVHDIPSSIVDPVTGLYSRTYFEARLDEELSRAMRHDLSLSVIRVRLGSDLPEAHLFAQVGQTIKQSVRKMDIVARTNDFEISALLPHTGESRSTVLERLYQRLGKLEAEFPHSFSYKIGAAAYPEYRKRVEIFAAAEPGAA